MVKYYSKVLHSTILTLFINLDVIGHGLRKLGFFRWDVLIEFFKDLYLFSSWLDSFDTYTVIKYWFKNLLSITLLIPW